MDHTTTATHAEFLEGKFGDISRSVAQNDFEPKRYAYGELQQVSNLTYLMKHWFRGVSLVSFIFMHMLWEYMCETVRPYIQGGF